MMTTTERLDDMIQIARNIDHDIEMRPHFTMTRSQLMNRISAYTLDRPTATLADCLAIYRALLNDPDLPLRD